MPDNSKSIAVVDLGTNTFHTVIFKKKDDQVEETFRRRHHVFLSEAGIETICEDAITRAHSAILDFQKEIEKNAPDDIQIVGTEGLRKASNGPELKSFIEEKLLAKVQVISGKREAELIAKGVLWQFKNSVDNAFIMDIGGGSVEFIHIKAKKIAWLQSFPLGVGVLYNQFQHQEPIAQVELKEIEDHIDRVASELVGYMENEKISTLIGASGSFELIPAIMEGSYPPAIEKSEVKLTEFQKIRDIIMQADLDTRLAIDGLPPVRARLIVVAFIIMNWMVKKQNCKRLLISKFAVKEGLAAEKLGLLNF